MNDLHLSSDQDSVGRASSKKVVIVDDSRILRAWLRVVLSADDRLVVVGEASDAQEARHVIKQTDPDVITLDIDMPGMDGLQFLEKVMKLHPMPVVMVSATTPKSAEALVKALRTGAVDFISKPTKPDDIEAHEDMRKRVHAAACSRLPTPNSLPVEPTPQAQVVRDGPDPLILIGASTGGVAALEDVLQRLDPTGPPVVVVQHMPGSFLDSFTQTLDHKLEQKVRLAAQGLVLRAGQVVFAPERGQHTEIKRRHEAWVCQMRDDTEAALHCPSVERLFASAVPYGRDVIAVILTGLGRDGAAGMKLLCDAGAATIGQDEASSIVYGMPRAAWRLGAVQKQLPLRDIGAAINRAAAKHALRQRKP